MSWFRKKSEDNEVDKRVNKKSVIFANTVLISGIIFFILGIIYNIYRNKSYFLEAINLYYLIPICAIGLFVFALRWRDDTKVNFSVAVISILFSLYLLEIVLFSLYSTDQYTQSKVAQSKGVPFDTRTKFQVVEDLRKENIDAYPEISPQIFIDGKFIKYFKSGIFPLTSISNKTTVFCNENGEYSIYKSDEHGFNNPSTVWKKKEIDIVTIGDSFTHGACVDSSDNISGNLLKAGYTTINLGRGGTGPLVQLGIIKEYAEVLTPKIVLWFYYEGNDLLDLMEERNNPTLMKYLNKDFSQGLFSRQKEIDLFVKKVFEMEFKEEKERETERKIQEKRKWFQSLMQIVKLWHLRDRLGLTYAATPPSPSPLFVEILDKGHKLVSSWGGELFLVYLPTWERYAPRIDTAAFYHRPASLEYHDKVLSIAESLNISLIDISEVFNSHPDPLSLFPFRTPAHYIAEGYSLVAKEIAKFIENRNSLNKQE